VPEGAKSSQPRLRHSIAGQVSMAIGRPASVVRRNASSSITPSWNQTARPDRDRLVGELAGRLAAPEDVDHVDRERHLGKRAVARLPVHLLRVGVDRDDALAALLQHRRDPVRRPLGVAAQPDDRPGLALVEHEVDVLPVPPLLRHLASLRTLR
jgi:hypothetical protein